MVSTVAKHPGDARDLAHGVAACLLWGLPVLALVVGGAIQRPGTWHLWLGAAALAVMAGGCLANAARCGRTHCYATGPVLALAAIWFALAALGVVAPHMNAVSGAVVVLVVFAFIAERPLGRYLGRGKPADCA